MPSSRPLSPRSSPRRLVSAIFGLDVVLHCIYLRLSNTNFHLIVTLLSSEPEVQYVALRNINLVVQKRPEILTDHIKVTPTTTMVLANLINSPGVFREVQRSHLR